jgi:16S rRNA processing protein RimM
MSGPELLEVGRLGRAHGVRGDLVVNLSTDRLERVAVGARLLIGDEWRTVASSRMQGSKRVIHLEGVDGRDAAEALAGRPIRAEPIDDPTALWVHELVGSTVVDRDGTARGTCVSVIANPASDLLELNNGALVPSVFIVESGAGRILIDPPEGLFEVFES